MHFKRTQLTSAVLWTLNNFLNQTQTLAEANLKKAVLDRMIEGGLGRALKVVHECYRFARDKKMQQGNLSSKTKSSLFSPIGGSQAAGAGEPSNEHVKEMFWCYNYLTGLGGWSTEQLLAQNESLTQFFLDDIGKEDDELDLSPALISLCTMIDQMAQEASPETHPTLSQVIYSFITSP